MTYCCAQGTCPSCIEAQKANARAATLSERVRDIANEIWDYVKRDPERVSRVEAREIKHATGMLHSLAAVISASERRRRR